MAGTKHDSARSAAQRRHATILFCDLSSGTELGNAIDLDDVAEVYRRLRSTATECVEACGGRLNEFRGDGMLAVFGHPEPLEDSARRALNAAIDLHAAVRELDEQLRHLLPESFSLRVHSGVHAGLLVVQPGSATEGEYALVGDPTNMATRLSDAAGPDEIYVSAGTARAVLPFFVTERLAPIAVQGRPEPVEAFSVLSRSGIRTRFEASVRRGLTPFIGRELELAALQVVLSQSRAGRVGLACIVGPAGLGKTRTAQEPLAKAATRGYRVLRAYCESHQTGAPLQPFAELLRQALESNVRASPVDAEARRDDAPKPIGDDLRERIAAFLRTPTTAASANPQLGTVPAGAHEASDLVAALAELTPLAVFIDDWQWADDVSRHALRRLTGAVAERAVLVIIAARYIDPGDPAASGASITLEPFTESDSRRAVSALLSHGGELGFSDRIHQHSGGNPLFIEELCRSPESVESPLPLNDLIEGRVQRLDGEPATIVRAAAVIGDVVPLPLLERVASVTVLDRSLETLAAEDLVFADPTGDTLRFKHGITRNVVYDLVGKRDRCAMHLRAARALEKSGEAGIGEELYESLAYHYAGAGDDVLAGEYAKRAGDKAMAASSLDRTRQQYRAALHALERRCGRDDVRRRWIEIARRWALACAYSPAREQLEVLERMGEYARALGDGLGTAQAEYWLGWIAYALGEQCDSIEHYSRALDVALELGHGKFATQIRASLGQSLAASCRYDEALALLNEAIELKRQYPPARDPPVGRAYATACKAMVIADRGDFAGAAACIDEALDILAGRAPAIEGSILSLASAIQLWRGHWTEAIEKARRARSAAERVSGPYVFSMSRALQGYAQWMSDHSCEALHTLQQSSDWLEHSGMCLYFSFNDGWLADALASAGRYEEARAHGLRAMARARAQDRVGEAMACRALAVVSRAWPDSKLESPEHYLELAMRSAEARGSRHEEAVTRLHRAELLHAAGRADRVREQLDLARVAFGEMNMRWHLARADRLAAAL